MVPARHNDWLSAKKVMYFLRLRGYSGRLIHLLIDKMVALDRLERLHPSEERMVRHMEHMIRSGPLKHLRERLVQHVDLKHHTLHEKIAGSTTKGDGMRDSIVAEIQTTMRQSTAMAEKRIAARVIRSGPLQGLREHIVAHVDRKHDALHERIAGNSATTDDGMRYSIVADVQNAMAESEQRAIARERRTAGQVGRMGDMRETLAGLSAAVSTLVESAALVSGGPASPAAIVAEMAEMRKVLASLSADVAKLAQPAAPSNIVLAAAAEKRVDPQNGAMYTHAEFIAHYGTDGGAIWETVRLGRSLHAPVAAREC